jgi:GNAT superfamily N-acetyltransferase
MGVELIPVTPDDDSGIDAYHSISAAADAQDIPDFPRLTHEQVAAEIRHPSPSRDNFFFLVRDNNRFLGTLEISLPTADNRHLVHVRLRVHPDHRRRGIGRQTFAAVKQFAREHGRSLLMGEYCEQRAGGPPRTPAPAAFAAAVGAQAALPEVRRRLDLTTVDLGAWRSRYEEALRQAKGYSLLWWAGPVPDELLGDAAYLDGRMVHDAPMGDLRYEPENVDADRIRAADETRQRRGQAMYQAGARDDQTGRLVAWSALRFDLGVAIHAWQAITIVDPNHRGHRLGLLVKLENLLRVHEVRPDLRYVDTWNAAENAHMIAINETIGFRPVDGWVSWQCDVDPPPAS